MEIKEAHNGGYIVTDNSGHRNTNIYKTLDEVFEYLLAAFERRSGPFGGEAYGHVKIFRKAGEKYTSPDEVEPVQWEFVHRHQE